MSHIFHFVWDMVLPGIGIVFMAWLFWYCFQRSHDRGALIFKWIISGLVLSYVWRVVYPEVSGNLGYGDIFALFQMWVVGVALFAIWRHSIIDLVANPLGNIFDGGNIEVEPKPYYSIALAKRKLNKPLEAIVEIRNQLRGDCFVGGHPGRGYEGFALGRTDI